MLTIYGGPGIGKTTLAASAPDPVFLDLEHGTRQIDVARTGEIDTWDHLLAPARHSVHVGRCADDGAAGAGLSGGAGGVLACAQRPAARQPGAIEQEVTIAGVAADLRGLSRTRAARFHHLRILHDP